MNLEYHYWITGVIAKTAGFNDSEVEKIAYCSQYVDDNDQILDVYEDEYAPNPCYQNKISQTMNITLPRRDLMDIYPLFHFIPGDQANASPRKDKKVHILNTTPGSTNAALILKSAVEKYCSGDEKGIFRLGIATHTFVDTWAHQNFAGCNDDFNGFANVALPNVGHADAMHHPDLVGHRWIDDRLEQPQIDNNARYLGASMRLFEAYKGALGKQVNSGDWGQLQKQLVGIWGPTYSGDSERGGDERTQKYRQLLPSSFPDYDDRKLQNSALDVKYTAIPGRDDFADRYIWKQGIDHKKTDWYLFQEAIKEHIEVSKEVLKNVFAVAGI
jgi:hypothetical protein